MIESGSVSGLAALSGTEDRAVDGLFKTALLRYNSQYNSHI